MSGIHEFVLFSGVFVATELPLLESRPGFWIMEQLLIGKQGKNATYLPT